MLFFAIMIVLFTIVLRFILSISLFAYITEHTVDKDTTVFLQKERTHQKNEERNHIEDRNMISHEPKFSATFFHPKTGLKHIRWPQFWMKIHHQET